MEAHSAFLGTTAIELGGECVPRGVPDAPVSPESLFFHHAYPRCGRSRLLACVPVPWGAEPLASV